MLPGAALIAVAGDSASALQPLAAAIYAFGAAVCHQQSERSFHLWTAQLPVCARCTGIYVGAALSAAAAVWPRRSARVFSGPVSAARAGEAWRTRGLLAAGAAPAALTVVYEWVAGHPPSNTVRASSGVLLGAAVAWIVLITAKNRVN
jgi:hypothetical protein